MKKICVISGTRADYGLLYWTLKGIKNSKELELQLIATCMHLEPKFGETWKQIVSDGFTINKKISLGELKDSRESIVGQISNGISAFFQAFKELSPDIVIVLGDRYEMLAAAQAAMMAEIPIGHIHGGEITEGAFDDYIRHTITKLSSYHFTSTEPYRKRVIQMGEFPERVYNIGAVGIENIRRLKLLSRSEIENDLQFKLRQQNFLVTYHPVTHADEDATDELLSVLEKYPDVGQVITLPNSDPGHSSIIDKMNRYSSGKQNVLLAKSLGSLRYLSIMNESTAVIGNSSSGIVEAPFFGVPTLNIGERQKGRLSDKSVIHCNVNEIEHKLKSIIGKKYEPSSLYGDGFSSEKLMSFLISKKFTQKSGFYDL